jgi:hypothetical protein
MTGSLLLFDGVTGGCADAGGKFRVPGAQLVLDLGLGYNCQSVAGQW